MLVGAHERGNNDGDINQTHIPVGESSLSRQPFLSLLFFFVFADISITVNEGDARVTEKENRLII